MLRYIEDIKTILFLVATTALIYANWIQDEFNPFLWGALMFISVSVTTITHNHNHLRIWKSKAMNRFQDYWLTVLYGFPVFAWIPTHNKNHHKFNNRRGDYTITYRFSEKNNLLTLLTYPTISSYYQQHSIRDYLKVLWKKRRSEFFWCISQYVVLATWIGAFLLLDWKKALLYVVAPQQFALFSVLVFNYLQHVHADEESERDHSRNVEGKLFNFFMFNNGLHTVHHDQPGLHWSKAPEAHAEVADEIDPRLNEKSFWWLILRVYILGPFIPKFRTKSMRLQRIAREEGEANVEDLDDSRGMVAEPAAE